MTNTSHSILSSSDLEHVTGGGGGFGPLSGDVKQQINTNWGGTMIINPPAAPAAPAPSPYRFEYLRQHPEARWAPPPYTPRPIKPY